MTPIFLAKRGFSILSFRRIRKDLRGPGLEKKNRCTRIFSESVCNDATGSPRCKKLSVPDIMDNVMKENRPPTITKSKVDAVISSNASYRVATHAMGKMRDKTG